MSFPFFIARRYFQTSATRNLIHRIGLISLVSIAVSTTALLLVLSVFNGLEELMKSLFRSFDPDIKVELKKGKRFTCTPELMHQLRNVKDVDKVVEVIEDNALLRYQDCQTIARIKGVSANFIHKSPLEPFIHQGSLKLQQHGEALAIVGSGIQYALSIQLGNQFAVLQVFYPNNNEPTGTMLPNQLYRCQSIQPGAVFSVEKQFDEGYVIVPIAFAETLMDMSNERTALEIQVVQGASIAKVQQALRRLLPDSFRVLDSHEQQAALMKAIYIERLFVFLTFSFILFVASLNIFFILSMVVLDKRKDMAILSTLGATSKTIKHIFLLEGLLIALGGTAIGIAAAWILSWLQQIFGIITIDTATSLVEAYPIKRQASDFLYTTIGVIAMTLIATYWPAQLASKTIIQKHL